MGLRWGVSWSLVAQPGFSTCCSLSLTTPSAAPAPGGCRKRRGCRGRRRRTSPLLSGMAVSCLLTRVMLAPCPRARDQPRWAQKMERACAYACTHMHTHTQSIQLCVSIRARWANVWLTLLPGPVLCRSFQVEVAARAAGLPSARPAEPSSVTGTEGPFSPAGPREKGSAFGSGLEPSSACPRGLCSHPVLDVASLRL